MELTTEVHFAQGLVSNQPELCEKTLKKVGTWLATKSVVKGEEAFSEKSLMELWQGLFYYFWGTDKPLVQEEKADIISSYIHVFKTTKYSFLYIDTFLQTMAREWLALDRYRIEKFMMLVRKFLHQTYQLLKQLKWELKWIKQFRKVMKKTVISVSESTPIGLKLHIVDIYMEELAKVGANELSPEIVQLFLVPYCRLLIETDDSVFRETIKKDVFLYLINQEEVDEELFYEFPKLSFDASVVQNLLKKYANKPGVRTQNMEVISDIIEEFEYYKSDVSCNYRVFADKTSSRKLKKRDIERSAVSLFRDEIAYSEEKKQVKKKKKANNDDIMDL